MPYMAYVPAIPPQVQYSVRCAPRAWLGPELLWEPVAVQPRPGGAEWMYELQRMAESPKAATAATALLAVFHLARMSPTLAGGAKHPFGGNVRIFLRTFSHGFGALRAYFRFLEAVCAVQTSVCTSFGVCLETLF